MTRLEILFASFACLLPVVASGQEVPHYKVDAAWPKELPYNWILGQVDGLAVDSDNHIWVLHDPKGVPKDDASAAQTPAWSHCCIPAPAVLGLDADGQVLQ